MEKKSLKKVNSTSKVAVRSKKKSTSKKIGRASLSISYFLMSSLTSFCYQKRKYLIIIFIFVITSTSLLESYKYVQARMVENSLFSDEDIVRRVSTHLLLPKERPLSLVRVENGEKLRTENPFYSEVKEGDYILAYPKLFVIYDAVHDEVKAVKESTKK